MVGYFLFVAQIIHCTLMFPVQQFTNTWKLINFLVQYLNWQTANIACTLLQLTFKFIYVFKTCSCLQLMQQPQVYQHCKLTFQENDLSQTKVYQQQICLRCIFPHTFPSLGWNSFSVQQQSINYSLPASHVYWAMSGVPQITLTVFTPTTGISKSVRMPLTYVPTIHHDIQHLLV